MPENLPEKSTKPPKTTCLIIVPFDAAGSRIKDTIQRALDDIEVRTVSLDNLKPGAAWVNAVTDAIKLSDFIVVDITRQNPNVMYELGYAHALRKPTILLVALDAKSPPPTDLQGLFYITYDPSNLRNLRNAIIQHTQRYTIPWGEK
jgi:predicted nucleotide-binding protein